MTNKEKFVEIFNRDPITSECPIYCNGEYGATKCPYDQPGCTGSWWDKEYKEKELPNDERSKTCTKCVSFSHTCRICHNKDMYKEQEDGK